MSDITANTVSLYQKSPHSQIRLSLLEVNSCDLRSVYHWDHYELQGLALYLLYTNACIWTPFCREVKRVLKCLANFIRTKQLFWLKWNMQGPIRPGLPSRGRSLRWSPDGGVTWPGWLGRLWSVDMLMMCYFLQYSIPAVGCSDSSSDCGYWTYIPSMRECFLYDTMGPLQFVRTAVSGTKECTGWDVMIIMRFE